MATGRGGNGRRAGYAAMTVTVAVWAGFALSLRGIGSSRLDVADVALIRFGTPSVLLLPLLPARRRQLARVPLGAAGGVLAGAGAPFFFVAAEGGVRTSAAAVGTLVPGLVPVFVAGAGRVAGLRHGGPRPGLPAGLSAVLVGVLLLVAPDVRGGLLGVGLLVLASGLWALYTTALPRTGLDPAGCALLLCVPNALVVAALVVLHRVPTALAGAPWSAVEPFLLVQGLGVGFVAALSYPLAVRRIGPQRAALLGTTSPALVALASAPVLGERIGPVTALGVALVTVGVLRGQWAARTARPAVAGA